MVRQAVARFASGPVAPVVRICPDTQANVVLVPDISYFCRRLRAMKRMAFLASRPASPAWRRLGLPHSPALIDMAVFVTSR
jgi:hypothetical protein